MSQTTKRKDISPEDIMMVNFDFTKLCQILNTLQSKTSAIEENLDKLSLTFGDFKENINVDVLKDQIDEKIRQMSLTQSNTNEKIMQMEIKLSNISEAHMKSNENQEKIVMKLMQNIKEQPANSPIEHPKTKDDDKEREIAARKVDTVIYEKIEKIEKIKSSGKGLKAYKKHKCNLYLLIIRPK